MSFKKDLTLKLMMSKYVSGGRDIKTGIDCYGLVIVWYKEKYNIELFDMESYNEKWSSMGYDYLTENQAREWVPVVNPLLGDVVLFQNERGVNNHLGVYLGNSRFIHANRRGINVGLLASSPWIERFVGFYRHKKFMEAV